MSPSVRTKWCRARQLNVKEVIDSTIPYRREYLRDAFQGIEAAVFVGLALALLAVVYRTVLTRDA